MEQKWIDAALRPLKRKIHLHKGLRILLGAFTIAAATCLLLVLVSLFVVIPFTRIKLMLIISASFPVALVITLLLTPKRNQVMTTADSLGLQERVITAWYLKDDDSPVARLQRQDLQKAFEKIDLRAAYQQRIPAKWVIPSVVLLISAFALSFIPGKAYQQTKLRESLITEVRQQEKLIEEKMEEQVKKHPELSEAHLEQLQEALDKLKNEMAKAKTEEDALKALAQLENLMEKFQSQQPLQDLAALQNALAGSPLTEDVADAMKDKDKQALEESLEQLKKELEEVANQQELAELLQDATQSMASESMLAEALQQVGANASAGSASSSQTVQNLAELIEQTGENANSQQAMTQVAGEVGKAASNARKTVASVDPNVNTGQSGQSGSQSAQGKGNQPGGKGQNGQGEGNQPGSGSGGSGNGKGAGGGAGEGSTGEDAGYQEGEQSGSGRKPGTRKENEYQRIYVPERLGGDGNESSLSGQKLESGSSTFNESDGAPVQKGAMVPWQEVLSEYREEAVQSMERQEIPTGMKDLVRDYFSSLK